MLRMLTLLLVLASSAAHGEPLWQFSTDGMVAGNPVVHQDAIYITGGTRLHALSRNGQLQWSYDAGAPSRSTVAVADDAIFMLADDGLHALDLQGKRLWRFETRDGPLEVDGTAMGWGDGMQVDPWAWYRSAPLVVDGKVVFGNRQGTYALNAKTGRQLWHAQTGTTHTRPAHHGGIVVVGSWDNHLYGLNVADGSIAWKSASRLPGGAMAGWLGWEGFNLDPVIDKGVVYAGNRGTHFYAIDARSGKEKWSWKHPSSWVGSPAVVSDKTVYFAMSDGNALMGMETRAGNQNLLFRNRFYSFARPQANDRYVFMASVSGELFAVEKSSGQGRKIFATEDSQTNLADLQSPNGGLKFFYSAQGGYTHENATKDVQRMLSMLDSLISLTLDGDTLYAGSANGNLYAISIAETAATNDTQALTQLLDAFLAGASVNDAAMHDRFWADDLVYTSSSGARFGKAELLAGVREEQPEPDEPAVVYSSEEVRVQLHGDMAVATFRLLGIEQGEAGTVKRYLNTGTFQKRGGEWRAVAWQATRVPEPD